MKRNTSWARDLLSFIEKGEESGMPRRELQLMFEESGPTLRWSTEEVWDAVDYHLHLLNSAGLVLETKDKTDVSLDYFELTWSGHDFLDR